MLNELKRPFIMIDPVVACINILLNPIIHTGTVHFTV
jgi:hypothetical protein